MSIFDEQNKPENVKLLAAMKHLYSRAKRIQNGRILLSFVLGLAGTIGFFLPKVTLNIKVTIAFIGLMSMLVELLFSLKEGELRKTAARVQEEFDTNIYGMAWSGEVVGPKTEREIIAKEARLYGDKRDNLLNWYPEDPAPLPEPFNILLCQRVNVVWTQGLTEASTNFFKAIPLVTGLVVLLLGFASELSKSECGLLFATWLAFLRASITLAIKMSDAHSGFKRCREKVTSAWRELLSLDIPPDPALTRKIQNKIFKLRASHVSAPDFLHRWTRDDNEEDTRTSAQDLKREALKALGLADGEDEQEKAGSEVWFFHQRESNLARVWCKAHSSLESIQESRSSGDVWDC